MRIPVNLIITLALLAGIILLQIYLSKSESKWPGLVLPIISFLFGLLCPLSMCVPSEGINFGFVLEMVSIWLLANVPTLVFLAIYFGCRNKQRRSKQLTKMNIQDLE